MKSRVTLPVIALLAAALGYEASSSAAGQPAASKPAAPASSAAAAARPTSNDALLEWVDAFFAWGEGKVTLETMPQVVFGGGARLVVARKTFTAEARMNDQAFLARVGGREGHTRNDAAGRLRRRRAPRRGQEDLHGRRAHERPGLSRRGGRREDGTRGGRHL